MRLNVTEYQYQIFFKLSNAFDLSIMVFLTVAKLVHIIVVDVVQKTFSSYPNSLICVNAFNAYVLFKYLHLILT